MEDKRTTWQAVSLEGLPEGELFVEVAVAGGREDIGLLEAIPFRRLSSLVTEISSGLGDALAKCAPSKAAVELGIEFGVKEGKLVGLIAQGSGKANLKITLEWDRPKLAE